MCRIFAPAGYALFVGVLLLTTGLLELRLAAQPLAGYDIISQGEWRWASPSGRIPAPPLLSGFISRTLNRMRSELETRGPVQPLVVYAPDRNSFIEVTRALGGAPPREWVVAVAFPAQGVMVLSGDRLSFLPLEEYPKTVAHELAHLVLGADRKGIPRWYHEGLAQWLSGDRIDNEWRANLGMLARQESLLPLSMLAREFADSHRLDTIYYRQSLSFVAGITGRLGEGVHARILRQVSGGHPFAESFQAAAGESLEEAEAAWHAQLVREFSWVWFFLHGFRLFQILAIFVVIGFFTQWVRRRRALRRMAREEEMSDMPFRAQGRGESWRDS